MSTMSNTKSEAESAVNAEIHTRIVDRFFSTTKSYFNKTKSLLPIGLVVVASFIVRIILFWQDKVIAADGISYVNISRSIFRGEGFAASTHFPPF